MSQETIPAKTGGNLPQFRSVALVGMGANYPSVWGDPTETIARASVALGETIGLIRAKSRYYRTPAFPAGSGPDFVNAAMALETDLSASEIIRSLHHIEAEAGRERRERWAARPLDLDLIALGDQVLPDPETHRMWREMPLSEQMTRAPEELILPHPRMHERAFVLVPLADVAPDWVHPVSLKTVKALLDGLPERDRQEIECID